MKTGKIHEKIGVSHVSGDVSKPPKTSQIREITENDEDEAGQNSNEKVPDRLKTGSKQSPKRLPSEINNINQLGIPEGVFRASIPVIRALIENKFPDKNIEKTLKMNYGNTSRDVIQELKAEMEVEKNKKSLPTPA